MPGLIGAMPEPTRLALEMAVHEEQERQGTRSCSDGTSGLAYSPYISVMSRRSRAAMAGASRSILFRRRFLLMVRI